MRRFQQNFDSCIEYLLKEWSAKSAFAFIEKVHQQIAVIATRLEIGKRSVQIKNVRSLRVKPYNRIYYKEEVSAIYIRYHR